MEQVVICPHCGNETNLEVVYSIETPEKVYSMNDPDDFIELDTTYYLTQCKTCLSIALYCDTEADEKQGKLSEAYICYPAQKLYHDYIPLSIRETYTEAKRIKNISPTAFAVMIRRGLEFICKEKKAKGRNLNQQLRDMGKSEIIPHTLVEMGDTLRFLGNLGAHATEYKIDRNEAQAMDDFFSAMIEFVYIAPEKLNKVKEIIKKKQKH